MHIRILNAFCLKQVCYATFQTDTYQSKNPRHALSNFESTYFNQSSIAFLTTQRPEDALSKQHAGFMSLRPLYSLGQMQGLLSLHWFSWLWHRKCWLDHSFQRALQKVDNSRSLSLYKKFKASSRTWVWGKGLVGFFGGYHLSKEVSSRIQLPITGSTAMKTVGSGEAFWIILKTMNTLFGQTLGCWKTPPLTTRSPGATCELGNPTMVDRRDPAPRQVSNVCGQYQETMFSLEISHLLAAKFHILKYFWVSKSLSSKHKQ